MQFLRKRLGAQALMAAVVIIGLYFGYSFAREVVQAERLSRQAENSVEINAQIAEENRKLERDKLYYESDEYAELRARTDLNMRQPDELVILPVMPADDTLTVASAAPSTAPDATAVQETNSAATTIEAPVEGRTWDRWLALFTTSLR